MDRRRQELAKQFPQLKTRVSGGRLVYLDNAATTLKPESVIERVSHYYREEVANIHRSAHSLANAGTEAYESARQTVANFIGAAKADEIVFTRGTTESLNLLASTLENQFSAGDEILLTEMEHHSNIVPWQMLAKRRGLTLRYVPVDADGVVKTKDVESCLGPRTRVFSATWVSNVLGTVNPVQEWAELCKRHQTIFIVDAAQAVNSLEVNVADLDCDFMAFSGHKIFAPTGIGVLYGRSARLNQLPPYQGGGSMISSVGKLESEFLGAPHRFEAGTPHIAGALGLEAALRFVEEIGVKPLSRIEEDLLEELVHGLESRPGIRLIGRAKNRVNLVSFLVEGAHPSDIGQILDQQGIAVRVGHHCCQPLMAKFGIPGTVRASLSIYNSSEDVRDFLLGLDKAREMLI